MLKNIFYNKVINKPSNNVREEANKLWVLKTDINKNLIQEEKLVDKAHKAIDDLLEDKTTNPSEMGAYLSIRKKNKNLFSQNNKELENPTMREQLEMEKLTLSEVSDSVKDTKDLLHQRYIRAFRGLFTPNATNTPTNDFIDNLPQTHDPFDDLGVD